MVMNRVARALALAGCLLPAAFLASAAAAQPAPGSFVDVERGKLWYETCGSGPTTMVLIHDGLLHSVVWDDVWPELCKTYHVVRYDRRGYGRSPEAKAPYSQIDDLAAVMRAAGMDHAVIVGSSNGGGLAIDFTLDHPRQVDKLVLVGPDVTGFTYSDYFQTRLAEQLAKRAQGDLEGALKGSWILARGDDVNARRLLALEKASPQDMNHQDLAMPAAPAAPRLGEIKVPTLVLVGEDDVADNQAKAGALEYAIKGAKRVVIRGAGHLVYMEQPAEFTRVVSGFVDPRPAVASPGTEQALRSAIEQIRRGDSDYSRFSPQMADIMRKQADQAKSSLTALGPVKSITFDGVGPGGGDIYVVAFEKLRLEWRIKLGQGGRIDYLATGKPR
jgi:pimeloyl-ACP methyl ester carboxylesterase